MATDQHLKNILEQVLESYNYLCQINDKAGDLDIINKEMQKINGIFRVVNKIDTNEIITSDFKALKIKIKKYIENYSFEKEISTMETLYSEDIHRLKNMRLKIIEALQDKNMMEDIEELIAKI